ncbi:hypothetical protein D3C72_1440430 [compost metagenome]
MHIFDPLGFPAGGSSATHTTAERDPHTSDLALERPQHQLFITIEVETCPVQVFDLAVKKGGKLCRIGNEVALIGKQRFQLCSQQAVAFKACARSIEVNHLFCSNSCSPTQ